MGHVVVGVELSEKGVKQFFEEHGLQYKEEPVPDVPKVKVFKVHLVAFSHLFESESEFEIQLNVVLFML